MPWRLSSPYPLKQKNFSFASLKGEDAHLMTTLTNAKSLEGQPLFDAWLLLMERFIRMDHGVDFEEEIYVPKVMDRNGDELKLNERKREWMEPDKDTTGWKMVQRPDAWMISEDAFKDYVEEVELDLPEEDQDEDWSVPFTPYSLAFKFELTERKEGCELLGNNSVPDELRYLEQLSFHQNSTEDCSFKQHSVEEKYTSLAL
jgi:hypothetical protein